MRSYTQPLREDAAIRRDMAAPTRAISTRFTEEAAAGLRNFDKPALVLWALERRRFFPLAHAHRLAALLPQAQLVTIDDSGPFVTEDQPDAVTRAADGFTIAVPVADLEAAGLTPYIVVGMNGHPLPPAHGFPARFFVSGVYGQFAGAKWLTEIHFTDRYVPGDWERRGWPHEPVLVRPHARIDGTRQEADALVVTGVAWAPPHGVAAVEVSVDGGRWTAAELAGEVAPIAWRRWRSRQMLTPGHHRIRARAVRSDGEIQDGKPRPPFPTGVSGYQQVIAVAGEDAHQ